MVVPPLAHLFPPAPEPMSKAELRRSAKAIRQTFVDGLSSAQRCAAAVVLADRVETRLDGAVVVAAYLPIGCEIDTVPLIDRLARRGVTLALPYVTGPRGMMRFLAWQPGDRLPAGPMGLRQPSAGAQDVVPDTVLVPLLAFDAVLHRLGYGAGHYDRALAAIPSARRIGLAWSIQRTERVPNEAWDVPLHAVATEQEWITQ